MTDDVRKLLGGYATGTLTEEEQRLLYQTALQDDELFAALADEQALKDILDDGTLRAQVLRATEEPRFSVSGGLREWFDRPKAKVLVGLAAVLLVLIGLRTDREAGQSQPDVAQVRRPGAVAGGSEPASVPNPSAPAVATPAPVAPAPTTQAKRPDLAAPLARRSPTIREPAAPEANAMLRGSRLEPPLRFELLLKGSGDEFHPVQPDYRFAAGDTIRVRVVSRQPGALAVSPSGQATYSTRVAADEPALLPAAGGIAISAAVDKLRLTFVPLSSFHPTDDAARKLSRSNFSAGDALEAPAANPRTEASRPVTIEIPIRQRVP